MLDRWWGLELRQRQLLAAVAVVVALVALVTGALVFTGGDGDDSVALTTRDDATSTTSSTTSTSSSTTTTLDPASVDSSTSSTSGTTSTTKKGSTTSTTRRGTATTTPGGSGGTTTTTQGTTTSTTQASGPCNPGGGNAMANQIATLYCSYRASHGLALSTRNSGIDKVAQDWAEHMAAQGTLAHNEPPANPDPNTKYSVLVVAACKQTCKGWAENVAFDSTASGAWEGWLASGGHLPHIADARAGEYGVGAAQGGGYWWFVQDFGYYP